jgi:hypothetical protein
LQDKTLPDREKQIPPPAEAVVVMTISGEAFEVVARVTVKAKFVLRAPFPPCLRLDDSPYLDAAKFAARVTGN